MTITFKHLKSANPNLSDEEVLKIIEDYDKNFYKSWVLYNQKINKLSKVDNYIISLPAMIIDDLFALLKSKK